MLKSAQPEVESPIPAAQYVRMSTEHQQYSLQNQASIIRQYALHNRFEVVQTYADPGRSGLVLKDCKGLWEFSGRVDRSKVTLLCRCAENNERIHDYHLLPNIAGRVCVREHDRLLATGTQVKNLRNLVGLVQKMKKNGQPQASVDLQSGLA